MDDNELCPLCCEELDMSDRQFFPCKCGYQVCMWCWHRIRESESGLCPACRTPYGNDPHEFSAVDVEEVVRANKEKAAAEKKEKERLRQQRELQVQQQTSQVSATANPSGSSYSGVMGSVANSSGADLLVPPLDSTGTGIGLGAEKTVDRSRSLSVDTPKDRSQLANMRVIRRDLVYAVGLPPNIAIEETLKKPEYFGQYGRVSKIVINRNYSGNGDPRRASASAYVTFLHKEDTLACILALDGFFLENRNIRASYGTSKYCSAFIKNVRCNNPDCTYLHYMGEPEDNFTKQEIQAGYVTSGRDVLARQQAQMAAAASVNGTTRRRIGGGGPSGTGKVPVTPVFPSPVYEEPVRENKAAFVPTPVGSKPARSVSVGTPGLSITPSITTGFAAAAAAGAGSFSGSVDCNSVPVTAQAATGVNKAVRQSSQKQPSSLSPPTLPTFPNLSATAASVVAATATTVNNQSQQVISSLTPLTPLKRAASLPAKAAGKPIGKSTMPSLNSQTSGIASLSAVGAIGSSRKLNNASPTVILHSPDNCGSPTQEGSIGGFTIIGGSTGSQVIGSQCTDNFITGLPGLSGMNTGFGALGSGCNACWSSPSVSNNVLSSSKGSLFGDTVVDNDIWGASPHLPFGSNIDTVGSALSGSSFVGRINSITASVDENGSNTPGGMVISGSNGGSGGLSKNPFTGDSGSSTLASLLGIDLPTGSGSLRETSAQGFISQVLPLSSSHAPFSFSCVPIGGLEVGSAAQHRQQQPQDPLWFGYSASEKTSAYHSTQIGDPGPIGFSGSANKRQEVGFGREFTNKIGGSPVEIGTGNMEENGNLLMEGRNIIAHDRPCSASNDIALLQSLLPGVQITRGNPSGNFSQSDSRVWGSPFVGSRDSMSGAIRDEAAGVVGINRNPTLESTTSWVANPTYMKSGVGSGEHDAHHPGHNIW